MPKKTAAVAPTRKPRVRRTPQQAKALILEAAIHVFSIRGPDAVGLKEVAHEAGVSHALITHYFGTYDGLVEAAVLECGARLRQRVIESVRASVDATPETILQLYLDAVLEPWYGRLVSWALISDHEGTNSHASQLAPDMKVIASAMHGLLVKQAGPDFGRAQSDALLVALWSMAFGYAAANQFFWRALGRSPGARRDRELREAMGAMTRAMFGGS